MISNKPLFKAPRRAAREAVAKIWRRFLAAVENYQRRLDRAVFDDHDARRRLVPVPVERAARRSHRR